MQKQSNSRSTAHQKPDSFYTEDTEVVPHLQATRLAPVDIDLWPTPAIGSVWRHKNGNRYMVYDVTNEHSDRLDEYPVTISYKGDNGRKWSRRLSRWYGSMTLIAQPRDAWFDDLDKHE